MLHAYDGEKARWERYESASELGLLRLQSKRTGPTVCGTFFLPAILAGSVTTMPDVIFGSLSYELRQLRIHNPRH